jgi:hypothetical protein
LQPTTINNSVQIGPTASTPLTYTSKLQVYDPGIPLIITSISYLNYNPYNLSTTATNNVYYNYTTPGTYTFNFTNPTNVTMYYFIVGGGGNGAAGTTLRSGGGGSGGQHFLGNIILNTDTLITITVGSSSQDSSITINNGTPIIALAGNDASGINGGASVGAGSRAGGDGINESSSVPPGSGGTFVGFITFADNFTNDKIKYSGGGGGGGATDTPGINLYNGAIGGGGGGGGAADFNVGSSLGGTGTNGANGANGNASAQTGGAGGAGKQFSTGGVGGGGGGGGGGSCSQWRAHVYAGSSHRSVFVTRRVQRV